MRPSGRAPRRSHGLSATRLVASSAESDAPAAQRARTCRPERRSAVGGHYGGLMSSAHAARLVATMVVCAALAAPALVLPARTAQAQAAQPAAAPSLARQLGLSVYPAKQQSAEKQAQDEQECATWAQQQTGVTPGGAAPNADSAGKAAKAA